MMRTGTEGALERGVIARSLSASQAVSDWDPGKKKNWQPTAASAIRGPGKGKNIFLTTRFNYPCINSKGKKKQRYAHVAKFPGETHSDESVKGGKRKDREEQETAAKRKSKRGYPLDKLSLQT